MRELNKNLNNDIFEILIFKKFIYILKKFN